MPLVAQSLRDVTVAAPDIKHGASERLISNHVGDAVVAMPEPERGILDLETAGMPFGCVGHRAGTWPNVDSFVIANELLSKVLDPHM
ncbi:hypothetical protein [Lysobacter sp. F60174L2]|uniref:hypothetical protein n=1 Tax=Lysobacter sp. F60174L2 TaxID=3459295 RepID=UPI00403DE1AB